MDFSAFGINAQLSIEVRFAFRDWLDLSHCAPALSIGGTARTQCTPDEISYGELTLH
jgi:hypothetical protein